MEIQKFPSGLKLKFFDCTGVMYHRKSWNMIKKRDGACQAILDGKFYFPTVKEGVTHCSHPNLKSVDEDKALLYRMICKYLISGALEYCPPGFRPSNLVSLGLVPKKDVDEPFCVIADGRQMNEYMLPWKTKMTGMAASAGMFVRGSYAFLRDFSSAYHKLPLGTLCNRQCAGCRPCRGTLDPRNHAPQSQAVSMGHPAPDPATTPFKPDCCRWEQKGLQHFLESSAQWCPLIRNPLRPDQQFGARPDLWDVGQAKTSTQLRVKSNCLAWSWTGNIFGLPWHILAQDIRKCLPCPFVSPHSTLANHP